MGRRYRAARLRDRSHAVGQPARDFALLPPSARNGSFADGAQPRRADRLGFPARDDRREADQRRPDGDFLFRRRARNKTGDRLRAAFVGTPGHPACIGGRRRYARPRDHLPVLQPRHHIRQRMGYTHGHRHRLCHRHPFDAGRPRAGFAQDIPHGTGHRRRPGGHSGHRALLRGAGADKLPVGGVGHHARGLFHEGDGREAYVLLSGARRGGLGAVLLFGRAFGHIGRGDGHADPDDAPLQQGVFRP